MRFLTKDEEASVLEIDKSVRNKFRWNWLERKVTVKVKKGTNYEDVTETLEHFINKPDVAGKAFCVYCNDLINYGSRGCIALIDHASKVKKHAETLAIRRSNYSLGCAFSKHSGVTDASHWGTLAEPTTSNIVKSNPITPLADRQVHSEVHKALILGVLAEHSLPLSLAPVLITTARELSKDSRALNQIKLERKTASYKMTYGLGKTFRDETIEHLRNGPFSLNLDESTSNSDKRILAILVSYLSLKKDRIVVEHLQSVELYKVDTASVLSAVEKLFNDNEIPWGNLVSLLMDSCSVMRGSKNGLEVRVRKEKAPQLLDINGDSCHHVHNACKKFCEPFDGWIEGLATDLHNDVKWSADLKIILREICEMLSVPFTTPQRFLSHRWLSCYDVSASNIVMMDAFRVMYYGFMTSEDKVLYRTPVYEILKARCVSSEGRERLKELWGSMGNKNMTQDGKNRKQRIVEKVIIMSKKTDLISSFYMAVLRLLKDYVLLFQRKTTLIHILHDKQEELLRNFLALFVKPEVLARLTAVQLKNISITNNDLLEKKDMFLGLAAEELMKKEGKTAEANTFLEKAAASYLNCAQHLQKRLPLDNDFLMSVSAIDPTARGHHLTTRYLKGLRDTCKGFLTEDEMAQISLEAHSYQVDGNLPDPFLMPIDKWWCAIKATGRYPALSKMILTVLTCFHGPMVEGSFNLMGDIVDIKSTRMDTKTFNAIQTVKYGLKARDTSALRYFKKKDVLHTPVDRNLCVNMRGAAKQQKDDWTKAASIKTQRLQKLKKTTSSETTESISSRKAKDSLKEREFAARQYHKRKAVERLAQLAAKRKKKE